MSNKPSQGTVRRIMKFSKEVLKLILLVIEILKQISDLSR